MLEVEMKAIEDLKPYPYNPRIHPDSLIDKLVRSIEAYGWTNPILLDQAGYVIAGNARLKAAIRLGLESVPVITLPLGGDMAAAYAIADNRLQELTSWDLPRLKDLLGDLDTGGFDMDLTGFDPGDIEDLMTASRFIPGDQDTEEEAAGEAPGPQADKEYRCPACGFTWTGGASGASLGDE